MALPNLMTVDGMIKGVRTLLLDKVRPYRYTDISLIAALNITLNEASRVRPDIFVCRYGVEVPQYEDVSSEEIPVEARFRLALEFGTAAHALMRDQEDVHDERAGTFNLNFYNILTGVRQTALRGATPEGKKSSSTPAEPTG